MPIEESVGKPQRNISPSILFDVLSSRRRRRILRYLADTDGPVFLDEIAAYIAEHEDDQQDRTIIAATLVHWELTKLADADLICFDEETHVVEEGPAASVAARHLKLVED